MARKQTSVFILSILLFSLVSNVQAADESQTIAQFGTGFDEVVIADSSDGLFDPRDLEFHPGRTQDVAKTSKTRPRRPKTPLTADVWRVFSHRFT